MIVSKIVMSKPQKLDGQDKEFSESVFSACIAMAEKVGAVCVDVPGF